MNFGFVTDEAVAFRIMDEAVASGINFFDTADVYGGPQRPDMEKISASPKRLSGAGLRKAADATGLCWPPRSISPWVWVPTTGLSAYHIRKACEDSLRRLKTDHIDLYQMYHIDRLTPWEEIWQAMAGRRT